jgi:hypothetical protein
MGPEMTARLEQEPVIMSHSERRAREHFLRNRILMLEAEIAKLSAELRAVLLGHEERPTDDAAS